MTGTGDDLGMTPRRDLDDRSADALLSGRAVDGEQDLSALLGTMSRLADVPAPAPSEALAALLETGLTAEQLAAAPAVDHRSAAVSWRAVSWRSRRTAGRASVVGAAFLGLLVSAAAANALPAPAQTAVATVVDAVTPLHLPRPAEHAPVPAVTPTSTPTPVVDEPTATPSPRPVPVPVATPHRDGGRHDGTPDGEDGRGTRATSAPDGTRDGDTRDDRERQAPRATASPTPEPRETEDGQDSQDGGSGNDLGSGGGSGGDGSNSLGDAQPGSTSH